jgi:hypothetical protein
LLVVQRWHAWAAGPGVDIVDAKHSSLLQRSNAANAQEVDSSSEVKKSSDMGISSSLVKLSSSEFLLSSSTLSSSSLLLSSEGNSSEIETKLPSFEFQSDVHTVKGEAFVNYDENQKLQISFSADFEIDAGPDVFIVLLDKEYEGVSSGVPSGETYQLKKQIAVSGQSVNGEMHYSLGDLTLDELIKFKSIHFYCLAYGYIHWGGSDLIP